MNATEIFQRAFAAHLRDPEANPVPQGVDAERAGVYVELLFNNVEDFLSGCFPVLRRILDDEQWNALVRQFYAEHACQSPFFREIPAEFVEWLTTRFASIALSERYPFLLELAHYEWVEVPLSVDATEINWEGIDLAGDLLEGTPVLNPVMLLQSYQYPVHLISPDYLPTEPELTHLVLLRDQDGKIQFVSLNAPTARLVQLLEEGLNARAAIARLAEDMQHPDPAQVLQFGQQILAQLKTQFVILGASKV
ncbi:DNA-binding domain-containing protein [Thiothrix nivea]|uniref:Uncharacterized protein n=1 Tax=Thiothrix nivea (strain ATCC 35100 / DSM 5205 / JP2) TaxID=870187 RepID=A0A656HGH8_THINJ|nr:DUF2063 domain-containing protein [Thiothrix nivea]EIJ35312.1 Protein of unknown function DUF2063 [Thiothrix nivea DSM 5205]